MDKPEGPNIQIRSIADGVVHPDYHPTSASDAAFCDAAIIKVDRPFIFNAAVKKIKLPPHDHDPKGINFCDAAIIKVDRPFVFNDKQRDRQRNSQ